MAFNGSGTYNLPGPPLVSGETVSANENNQFRNDVAETFNNVLSRDGQTMPTANLPMDGFKLTGLAAGTTAGDSVRYEQVTNDVAITGGSISGVTLNTGNATITGGSISGTSIDLTGSTVSGVSIQNSTVGSVTPSTGAFTSLSATTVSGSGFSDYLASPPVIGGTTPNNGTFVIAKATAYQETKAAISASNIDLSTANYFSKTISGTTSFTVSNIPTTGTAASFILDLTNGGSATVTWWSGMKWSGGIAPTLTASGRDVLGFFTYDGGTTWSGLVLGKDVK